MRVNGAHLKIYHTSPSSPDGSDLDTEFLSSSPELRDAAIDSSIEFSEGVIDTQQLLEATKVEDEKSGRKRPCPGDIIAALNKKTNVLSTQPSDGVISDGDVPMSQPVYDQHSTQPNDGVISDDVPMSPPFYGQHSTQLFNQFDDVPEQSEGGKNEAAKKFQFNRRQRRVKEKTKGKMSVVIDLDDHHGKSTSKRTKWIETPMYTLYSDEEAKLLNSDWLIDNIINSAQVLLKNQFQFHAGLQDVSLGCTLAYAIQRSELIQILHNGSCHSWLLITTIGAEKGHVFVYDSLYPSVGSNTKLQIAALLATSAPHISVKVVNCQRQKGGNDCGLFAVAFATALANGLCPESYTFKQGEMRQHLYNCLKSGKITMFPAVPRKVDDRIKSTDKIPVFCNCRLPEMLPMVECSKCNEWFHTDCVFVPDAALNSTTVDWFCKKCSRS